jgi:protein-S-isoprenylcysteine O-methyltransferase
MIPAFILTILAIFIRIIAFFTAKSNFTHKIAYQKVATHKLVQNGIYSILRHPSYTGFFYYTVFSMIFIGNWLSAILFGLMLSVFFEDRIQYE